MIAFKSKADTVLLIARPNEKAPAGDPRELSVFGFTYFRRPVQVLRYWRNQSANFLMRSLVAKDIK
jgi:hypothetical protein